TPAGKQGVHVLAIHVDPAVAVQSELLEILDRQLFFLDQFCHIINRLKWCTTCATHRRHVLAVHGKGHCRAPCPPLSRRQGNGTAHLSGSMRTSSRSAC